MANIKAKYILRSKGKDLGKVEFDNEDWPWFSGRFIPLDDNFAACAHVFREDERLIAGKFSREERDKIQQEIILMELQLVNADSGKLEGEPDLLHICGDRIRWRGHTGALRNLFHD